MDSPELQKLRAAISRDPGNAELRYQLGAELAERREYPEAVVQMRTALDINPKLHFARLQLGLLYLTMAQPDDSLATWAPLEDLEETAALKSFKRGLEALIRDDFPACIGHLQRGIDLNKHNTTLNDDMSQLIQKVRDGSVIAAPSTASPPRISRVTAKPREPSTDPGARWSRALAGLARSCYQRSVSQPAADDFSLPAWAYTDPEFLALERERIFRPSWQVICHLSEIPKPGDYQCFDFIGEMLFALRGNDGQVRVFHNVCRHRAARLLDGPRGSCTRRIVCPYHAWSYDFEGKLASVGGDRSAFPDLDISRESLVPVQMEIYQGFVFARIQGGGPSVAEMMAPYHDEVVTHEFEKLEPIGRVTLRPRTVNWKNVGDNYSDALHIPVAHPGLTRLLGASYGVQSREVGGPHVG
jgi:nitrite reductase/ring-hydroxylating ferredoxin subunit